MTSTVTPGLPDSVNAVPDKENWSPLPQEIKLSEIRDKVKYLGQKKKKKSHNLKAINHGSSNSVASFIGCLAGLFECFARIDHDLLLHLAGSFVQCFIGKVFLWQR